MKKKLAIIGAGGHGKVIGEIASLNNYEVIDFFDDKYSEIKDYPFKVVGNLKTGINPSTCASFVKGLRYPENPM